MNVFANDFFFGEGLIWIWKVHLVVSWAMIGLIWTVQLAIYPRFRDVVDFVVDHSFYTKRIGMVVGPLMLTELFTGILLLVVGCQSYLFLFTLGLLGIVWGSTALIQIPIHRRLTKGFDNGAVAWLNRTNWIRTVGWSLRGLGLLLFDFYWYDK